MKRPSRFQIVLTLTGLGVGATVLYPVGRRLIQNAHQTEAKVALAQLFVFEETFRSDFGVYGNNVAALGFHVPPTQHRYLVGFFDEQCGSHPFPEGIRPAQDSPAGERVGKAFNDYYVGIDAPLGTRVGNGEALGLRNCAARGLRFERGNGVPDVDPGGRTFLAAAMGVVDDDASPTDPDDRERDVWSVDHERRLVHVQDGVR